MKFPNETKFDGDVMTAAKRHGVPAALLLAFIATESQFNEKAQNLTGGDGRRGGSYGLMQVSLKTAQLIRPGVTPEQLKTAPVNLDVGARYLADLLVQAGRTGYGFDSAISCYNAGGSPARPGDGKRVTVQAATPNEARKYAFVNQAYVNKVLGYLKYFMGRGYSTDAPAYSADGKSGEALVIVLAFAALGLMVRNAQTAQAA